MDLDPAPAATSLAPGFRFHPTDQELIGYYLKRKVCGKPFRLDAISEIDIYKSEPWDLPGKSKLKSRDLEWYFFSALDKKYGNGWRTNRATERGYWKTTGKDRSVLHKSRTVGMKKTLVYHIGRAPWGERTNWVMHEYKLVDEELEKTGNVQDALVLCKIFQKSGSGPKTGEQYGAPFVEEEWEDDELVIVPGKKVADEVTVGDEAYLDGNDLEQILGADIPSEDVPLPLSFYYEDDNGYVQEPVDFDDDSQKLLLDMGGSYCATEQPDGQHLFDFPVQNDIYTRPVRHEYIGEPSNTVDSADADYLLDEPFMDANDNTQFDDGSFLETNDLSNPVKTESSGFDMVEEYLTFFDADDNNSPYTTLDSSKMIGKENLDSHQTSLTQKCANGGAQQETMGGQQLLQGHDIDVASTSKKEPGKYGSEIQHPFMKQASCMLSSKDAALQLSSTSHSSSSIRVTAGIIHIRNITSTGNGTYWSLSKHVDVSIVLSFGLSYDDSSYASLESMDDDTLLGKAGSASSWGWFYLIFLWFLILSLSFKIGTCIYAGKAS
ncbi:NAC domain-containing protein 78-like isoform X2 [Actinidia eriantha]|uniref:NAC domain-containing protein 78-like isoform X2 n=1 Tax=Actinidia eriantha TaxID=165200 RepID=UPI0025901D8F|nr:NAC domain-containing protein 78-like isoform X2 [Actinidia eriantha]